MKKDYSIGIYGNPASYCECLWARDPVIARALRTCWQEGVEPAMYDYSMKKFGEGQTALLFQLIVWSEQAAESIADILREKFEDVKIENCERDKSGLIIILNN